MPLESNTLELYQSFSRYVRDESVQEPDGLRPDRAPTYRRLVQSIVFENLSRAYPITESALGKKVWRKLISSCFAEWDMPSPELWRMPYALLEYVQESKKDEEMGIPYLQDLLRFEWEEIEVFMMPDVSYSQGLLTAGNKLPIQINLESSLLQLEYPVHRLPAKQLEAARGEYYLVCFRHPKTLKATYVELSGFYARVMQLLYERPRSQREVLFFVAQEAGMSCDETLLDAGQRFFDSLEKQGMVAGYLPG